MSGEPLRPGAASLSRVRGALVEELGPSAVKSSEEVLQSFGRDESDTGEFLPDLVVFPATTSQVQSVFRTCGRLGVPLTPVGARTGKSGGSLPLHGGVSMSLERMNRVKRISAEDLVAVAEPGVVTGELIKAVEALGLFYPPDPASLDSCTLGGNVAENAGGPRALKYGVTRDYVIGLEWVLPNGEAIRVGRSTIKGVAGYDLVGLFVGSEGTLGVATEVTVQLLPLPKKVMTALIAFPSVFEAASAVSAVLAGGILPRTLELIDDVSIRALDGRGVPFSPGCGAAVLAEVDGRHDEALLNELAEIGETCTRHGATQTMVAQDESQRARLWAARRMLSTALRALKPFKVSDDIAVPRSRLAEVITRLKALGAELGLTVATYGHAGDGNLHCNILFDDLADRPKVNQAIDRMLHLAIEVGGTITGEHGVGYAKRDYLALEQGPGVIDLQRRLKRFFDPAGTLNPGKIFPAD